MAVAEREYSTFLSCLGICKKKIGRSHYKVYGLGVVLTGLSMDVNFDHLWSCDADWGVVSREQDNNA